MKILIWIGCIFVAAAVQVAFLNGGIILGAIPMALLFGGMCWLANSLCKKYDANKSRNQFTEGPKEESSVDKFIDNK